MRDPRVWGDDADDFKPRDLDQYRVLSTGCMVSFIISKLSSSSQIIQIQHLRSTQLTKKTQQTTNAVLGNSWP